MVYFILFNYRFYFKAISSYKVVVELLFILILYCNMCNTGKDLENKVSFNYSSLFKFILYFITNIFYSKPISSVTSAILVKILETK